MNNLKTSEFHRPFIKSLIVVGLVTMVSMISSRYLIEYYLRHHYSTTVYTSQESQMLSK